MKQILLFAFAICLLSTACRDKVDQQSVKNAGDTPQVQSEIIELEKQTELNLSTEKDIKETLDELDALLKEIDE